MALEGLGWPELRAHPSSIVGEEIMSLVDLWSQHRGNGTGNTGHLPFAGGSADQPALVMAVFEVMNWAESKLRT
jgi:hypothetical protein